MPRCCDLRNDILAGTFQVQSCTACAANFRVDRVFNYLDMARGQWISVQPLSNLENWTAHDDEAQKTFDLAYGSAAPGVAARNRT